MPRSWEDTGRGRNGRTLIAGDYSAALDHEQPLVSLSKSVHAHGQLGLGHAPTKPCPHSGPLFHGEKHFEKLGVNAPPPLFFLSPPFLSQQPTGSKRPFAVVKATPYHEDGAVKWQQPRALLSISTASLARPRCCCRRCSSARVRAALWGPGAATQPAWPWPCCW